MKPLPTMRPTMSSKQISGAFISLTNEENDILFTFLENAGYKKDAKGIKEYIFDCIFSELEENTNSNDTTDKEKNNSEIYDKIKQYINENPETVEFYKSLIGNAVSSILKVKKK